MKNPLDELKQSQTASDAPTAEPVLGKNMTPEQRKALIRKIVIFDFVVILPIAAYLIFTNVLSHNRPTQINESEVSSPPTQQLKQVSQTEKKEIVLRLPNITQAYKQTNVERVKFNPLTSKLSPDAKEYLYKLFAVTDNLVIERVYNYSALYYKQPLRDLRNYDNALSELSALPPPAEATEAHGLIVSAITDQRDYFKFLSDTKGDFNVNNPLVQRSHSNLLRAWQLWLAVYDDEEAQNKLSFEKHLCALDFI
jgi:hypothetical protein